MRHCIRGAERNDSERNVLGGKTLQHVMNGAIAPAGDDGIESVANRRSDLRRGIGCCARRFDVNFDSGGA